MNSIQEAQLNLEACRMSARLELESLAAQCEREIRNLSRFDDKRMLVAIADLQTRFDQVDDAAGTLEEAFERLASAKEEAEP